MYTQPYSQTHAQSTSVVAQHSQQIAMAHPHASLFQDGSAPVFRACASAMQRPTLTNVRIRSTRDANQIFFAVLRNLLPMTVRRLDAEERRAISSGNVYVWEERGASSEATGLGIERWTDGMRWSPSRVRDEFLFYHQKEMDPDEVADLPPTRWARTVRPKATGSDGSSSDASPDKIPHQRALNDPEKLIKQTYSVLVALPEDRQRGVLRKWHLTAYFTQATVDNLGTVDEMLPKPHVMVPDGLFRSARAGKIRRDTASGRQPQQQQPLPRQGAYAPGYGPDAAGPSGSSPASAYPPSASVPSSSTFSPRAASYAQMAPHAYSYARSQYSAYVQHDVDAHRPPLPPPGATYAIAPVPAPPPPPPPQGQQGAISAPARGLGITYARPPRDWDQGHERGIEPMQQLHRDRERVSPQRLPLPLPNTYDPSPRGPVGLSVQSRSPSFAHPYASALQSHAGRVSGNGVVVRPPVSNYYSPAKPIEPIDVTIPRHVQPVTSSATSGPSSSTYSCDKMDYEGAGNTDVEIELETETGDVQLVQRESEVGPSPRHKSLHLQSARLSASPRSLRSSISCPQMDSGSRLRSASLSGTAISGSATEQGIMKASPLSGKLSLEEERARSLVPLDSLENAVFPRRDPTDDALLRRFNALRTTLPNSASSE